MINVSESTKSQYVQASEKHLIIEFPNLHLVIPSSDISQESFELTEVLETEKFLTFIGCNSSQMKVSLSNITDNLKGEYVEVSIQSGDTDIIPLFHGYVDTHTITNYTTSTSDIVAYDYLYTLSTKDIAQWYIHLWDDIESITLGDFRRSLFTYLDLDAETVVLPNDGIEIVKEYSPQQMNALETIKALCQINGVYGIIDRYDVFRFRVLPKISGTSYPIMPYYNSLDYQRWSVVGINKVTVRQNENVEGGYYGDGSNNYIIQSNIFTLNLEPETLAIIAENVLPNVEGRPYIPYNSEVPGFPWMEVGDIQTYKVYDYENNTFIDTPFYLMRRVLSGIVALNDTQNADGEQYQRVFISSLNTQIDTIKDQIEEVVGKLNALGLKYVMFYNERAIDIADGHRQAIASNEFAVAQASQIHIEMEYLLECTTTESEDSTYITDNDLQVTMLYEFDGVFIDSRQPKETYQDGKHILHTYYVINVPDAQPHSWRVFLECSGGSVHIDQLQAQNTILGLGTLVGDLWDGTIKPEDIFEPIAFNGFIGEFTDSVSVTPQPPTPATANEVIPALTFGDFIGGFTESIEFDSSYLKFYPYDGVTTSTCTIQNYKWRGAGDVILPELTLTSNASIIADADEGITFLISDDSGTTWYGWNGVSWVENYNMSLTQFNDLTEYKGLSVIVKATLLANNYLTNIKVYGGTI